jgi:hypothetical protein
MKATILTIAAALVGFGALAQNQNVTNVTKTTVTTVKDSDGEKKLVRDENVKTVQNIEFQNAESKALNKDVKPSPVQVTSTVEITGPDGRKRTVDVDRSAYYSLGSDRYKMTIDNTGYTLLDPKGQRAALLRHMSVPNSYIYRTKDKTSVGHFDSNGNLILETYDDKTDRVTVETFTRNP